MCHDCYTKQSSTRAPCLAPAEAPNLKFAPRSSVVLVQQQLLLFSVLHQVEMQKKTRQSSLLAVSEAKQQLQPCFPANPEVSRSANVVNKQTESHKGFIFYLHEEELLYNDVHHFQLTL